MPDAGELSLETFAVRLQEEFRAWVAPELTVELRLAEVTSLGPSPSEGAREPFSILFRGPPGEILPQRIYALEHETLGALELFLVPLAPDSGGARYEAVFT